MYPIAAQWCRRRSPPWTWLLYIIFRPTQSIMYVALQVNRFQFFFLLIVQYKYLKSCSGDFYSPESDPPHKIMRYWFYYSISWFFHFHLTMLVRWKWFVPQLYHFRRAISGRPALKYFCMIHRVGRVRMYLYPMKTHTQHTRLCLRVYVSGCLRLHLRLRLRLRLCLCLCLAMVQHQQNNGGHMVIALD